MIIYFVMFIIVALLSGKVQQLLEQGKKRLAIMLSIIVILIPSIISGVRDTSIGTDVDKYVGPDFHYAVKSNSIVEYFKQTEEEPLYAFLNYMVSRFTDNVHYMLFAIQLIMTTLVYITICKQRKKISMPIAMLVYMTLIYTRFLNLIRQGLAVSVVIFAFNYVEKKKLLKFLVCIGIASLFHRTAILALPIYLLYWCIDKGDKKSSVALIISYIILIISVFYYDIVLEGFVNFSILPDKFEVYLGKFKNDVWDMNIFLTAYKAIWIIIFAFLYKKMSTKDNNIKFLINMLLIDIILLQFSIKIQNAERISYYYGCIGYLLLIPTKLHQKLKDGKNIQLLVNFLTILLLAMYFYWCFIHHSAGEIYPYKSKILGI